MNRTSINVSIGICVYNEAESVSSMLDSVIMQKTRNVEIKEIIFISDACRDKTDSIISKYIKSDSRIKLLKQKDRKGKYAAINLFMEKASSPLLVLSSGDIILESNAIEKLCMPFLTDDRLGITGDHPIPVNKENSIVGYTVNLQWGLLHRLSLNKPKFGELIAFRNVIGELPPTSVDEECIAAKLKKSGYSLLYVPDSVIRNKGPENVKDFIKQRRRIYSGHIKLKEKEGYAVPTLNNCKLLFFFIKNIDMIRLRDIHKLSAAIILESTARILGWIDVKVKKDHTAWAVSSSAKIKDKNV